jgi:hypothetical protein
MSVTREKLYEEVWAEAMTTVAARYDVSGNYLARVCQHLNVPHPPRGYWAKLKVGKAPKQPALPEPRPGEAIEWERGDWVPKPHRSVESSEQAPMLPKHIKKDLPTRHALVSGVQELFEKARLTDVGYLRPLKRNLVDIFVSQQTLSYALDAANELFLTFERRRHRVILSSEHHHRPELYVYEGQRKFDYYNSEPWRPGKLTLVFVGDQSFGLTLYELTEKAEVEYEWDRPIRYVRVSELPTKRKHRWADSSPRTEQMPCGRLALRAFCPTGWVTWEQHWRETKPGQLARKAKAIVSELEGVVPSIVEKTIAAKKEAEIRRQQWEVECRERERQEQERRRAEAFKESRQELLAIVDRWALARNIESFFEDAQRRAGDLPAEDQALVIARLEEARQMLGGTNALDHFRKWKSPDER